MWYIIINTTPNGNIYVRSRNIYCRLCFKDAIKVARNWSNKIYGKPHITKTIFKDYY